MRSKANNDNATTSTSPSLRIVVVNTVIQSEDELHEDAQAQLARSRALRIGLLQAGYNIIAVIPGDMYMSERIAQLQPDMIIIDAESDSRDVLEHMVMLTRDAPRPIVLFTEDGSQTNMAAAMEAGVSAYVVAGLQSERIKPVLDVAMARFNADQKLRSELSDTKAKLQERKTIERAKGLLMERHHLSENEAYQKMRKQAMEKNLKLVDLAQRMLDVADLLGG
ncbi:ANTAR domain-containing response regulator [Undibacterium umbellatum]|jgi:response regulator NasT|uniref:ANTAR domain-containing protein n=1 Tax=Undibacterium umbellatum TaxID=2762300 RepID=A0ABR6Z5Y4_9BURK|nr:ANTAR domain-containing protein [Undibacterium umbellatum]MBC3907189.1 ANTAR domain-containing protein [Undibacterium umbellatum]